MNVKNRSFAKFVFVMLLMLRSVGQLHGQETIFRHVPKGASNSYVEIVSMFSVSPSHGYLPVRMYVANSSPVAQRLVVSFKSQSQSYRGEDALSSKSQFELSVDAESNATREILVPLKPFGAIQFSPNTGIEVKLTGSMGTLETRFDAMLDRTDFPVVLMSEALHTPNSGKLTDEMNRTISSSGRYGSSPQFAAKFAPKLMPTQWQGLSGVDVIMLSDGDWLAMESASRLATEQWLRLGGHLVIFHQTSPEPSLVKLASDAGFGRVTMQTLQADFLLDPAATLQLLSSKDGEGNYLTASIMSDFADSWPLYETAEKKPFYYTLYVVILIAFAVFIGPLNVYRFAKNEQRYRLFYTIPLISLAFTILLGLIVLFQDGVGGSGARRVLMEIRPNDGEHVALMHQEQFCQTGLLTQSKFALDSATIYPVAIAATRWSRFTQSNAESGAYDIEQENERVFAKGDWFKSRSAHGHLLTAVVPTRGRIEKNSGAQTFVSTFNFPIRWMLLEDGGKFFLAENIKTGVSFSAREIDEFTYRANIHESCVTMNRRHAAMIKQATQRKNAFIAMTDQGPAIESLAQIRWKSTESIITGPWIAGEQVP